MTAGLSNVFKQIYPLPKILQYQIGPQNLIIILYYFSIIISNYVVCYIFHLNIEICSITFFEYGYMLDYITFFMLNIKNNNAVA